MNYYPTNNYPLIYNMLLKKSINGNFNLVLPFRLNCKKFFNYFFNYTLKIDNRHTIMSILFNNII